MKDCVEHLGKSTTPQGKQSECKNLVLSEADLCADDRKVVLAMKRQLWEDRLREVRDKRRMVKALTLISVTRHTDPAEGQKWCQDIAGAALLGGPHADLPPETTKNCNQNTMEAGQ